AGGDDDPVGERRTPSEGQAEQGHHHHAQAGEKRGHGRRSRAQAESLEPVSRGQKGSQDRAVHETAAPELRQLSSGDRDQNGGREREAEREIEKRRQLGEQSLGEGKGGAPRGGHGEQRGVGREAAGKGAVGHRRRIRGPVPGRRGGGGGGGGRGRCGDGGRGGGGGGALWAAIASRSSSAIRASGAARHTRRPRLTPCATGRSRTGSRPWWRTPLIWSTW